MFLIITNQYIYSVMSVEDVYRENYEALSGLPIVKQLLKENKKLRRKVRTLETLLYEFPALFESRKKKNIKTESNVEPTLCDTLVDDEVVFVPKSIEVITPLHTENAQSVSPRSLITAHEVGVLNVQRCKTNTVCNLTEEEEVLNDAPNVFIKIEKDDGVVESEADSEVETDSVVESEVEEEEEEPVKPTEDDTEVFEITVKGKAYYTNNEINGNIYKILEDEDVGPMVGKFVNGKAKFTA